VDELKTDFPSTKLYVSNAVAAHKNVLLNSIYLVLNILNPKEYFNANVPHAAVAHI
jgi:hypothetical protein